MGILFVNIFFAAFKDGLSPAMIMASALVIAVYLFGWYKGFKVNLFPLDKAKRTYF